jgi:hypothetical protein
MKAMHLDIKIDDWRWLENVGNMYDKVYGKIWQADITKKLYYNVCRDEHHGIVETEADAYRQITSYSMLHPVKLVQVGEVGEHISQKWDGNVGHQQFIVASDMRAQVQNSFKKKHVTVLRFPAGSGTLIICTLIIATLKLKVTVTDATDFNPLSKDAEDLISEEMKVIEEETENIKDEHNTGVNRMLSLS